MVGPILDFYYRLQSKGIWIYFKDDNENLIIIVKVVSYRIEQLKRHAIVAIFV